MASLMSQRQRQVVDKTIVYQKAQRDFKVEFRKNEQGRVGHSDCEARERETRSLVEY